MPTASEWLLLLLLIGLPVWVLVRAWASAPQTPQIRMRSERSILSGTAPQGMAGELAEQLRGLQMLPDTGWSAITPDEALIQRSLEQVLASRTFSVLELLIEHEASAAPDGVSGSWRLDCVRSGGCHLSRSLWNAASGSYGLDEWVCLDDASCVNAGLWMCADDPVLRQERTQQAAALYPERALERLLRSEVGAAGTLHFSGIEFLYLEARVPVEGAAASERLQLWIERDSGLLSKYRCCRACNGRVQREWLRTYGGYGLERSIRPPQQINVAPDGVIHELEVDVVEHW